MELSGPALEQGQNAPRCEASFARDIRLSERPRGVLPRLVGTVDKNYVRYGKIVSFRIGRFSLWVGPHWGYSLLMLATILGAGILFVWSTAYEMGALHVFLGVVATSMSSGAFLLCFFSNPGILKTTPSLPGETGLVNPIQVHPTSGETACQACAITQPAGALHCEFCLVCVDAYDHHCPWMGKCIGSGNLKSFYTFLYVSLGSLCYIVFVALLAPRALP